MDCISHWLKACDLCIDVLALQEVGGIKNLQVAQCSEAHDGNSLPEFVFPDDELDDYYVFGTDTLESHLGQMILISRDAAECILSTYHGERVIGVQYRDTEGKHLWVFSVHMPHQDNSDDAYLHAIHELRSLAHAHKDHSVIVAGDFNADVGSARALSLEEAFGYSRYTVRRPDGPTRFGRVSNAQLDFVFISQPLRVCLLEDHSKLSVVSGSRREIGSDHDRIAYELVFGRRLSSGPRHRNRGARSRCGRYSVKDSLKMGIQCCIGFEALDLAGKWETLKQFQTRYTYRTPSHKFKDSPYLKSLCMDRRCCSDVEHKAVLTRAIVARRAHEKADWLQKLEHSASSGNAYAIRYLRKRVRHPSPWDGLVKDAGSKSAAAGSIQTHFQKLFQPPVPLEDQEACDCIMRELQLAASSEALKPFTWPEVAAAVNRLKLGKSTGMTGISCELISAMWQVVPEGQNMVVSLCNSLSQEEQHPPELHQSLVALLPKLPVIQATNQIRPINLVEVCHKMYSFLLLQRLRPTWPSPAAQHGAVRGGQVFDALASAHWWIAHESISQMHGRVWLNADLTAAFDSLCHRSLLQFVQAHTQDGCHHEALRLMQIVMRPQLHFIWQQFQWDMGQSSGVQQGHSHSAILFAYVVGHILEDLFKKWRERGEDTTTRDWGWLFVDDLLCSFDSWTQARKLVPEIVEAFGRA